MEFLFEGAIKSPSDIPAFHDLGHFKPSSMDEKTFQNEFHEHLIKNGLYSRARSHPTLREPGFNHWLANKTTGNTVDFHQDREYDEGHDKAQYSEKMSDHEYKKVRMNKPRRTPTFQAVWSNEHGTLVQHNGITHEAKPHHVVLINDRDTHHSINPTSKSSTTRYFGRADNVHVIGSKGLTTMSNYKTNEPAKTHMSTTEYMNSKLPNNEKNRAPYKAYQRSLKK